MNFKGFVLSIETIIGGGSISLLDDSNEIAHKIGSGSVSKAEDILFEVEQLLSENRIEKKALRLITISYGYGSFTGERIGLSFAKGLRKSLDCRVVLVSLLESMCLIEYKVKDIIICVPKGSREIYIQEFIKVSDYDVESLSNPIFFKIEKIDDFINLNNDKTIIFENHLYERILGTYRNVKNNNNIIKADRNLAKYVGYRGIFKAKNASDNNNKINK